MIGYSKLFKIKIWPLTIFDFVGEGSCRRYCFLSKYFEIKFISTHCHEITVLVAIILAIAARWWGKVQPTNNLVFNVKNIHGFVNLNRSREPQCHSLCFYFIFFCSSCQQMAPTEILQGQKLEGLEDKLLPFFLKPRGELGPDRITTGCKSCRQRSVKVFPPSPSSKLYIFLHFHGQKLWMVSLNSESYCVSFSTIRLGYQREPNHTIKRGVDLFQSWYLTESSQFGHFFPCSSVLCDK